MWTSTFNAEAGAVSTLLELLEHDKQISAQAATALWNLCLNKRLQSVLATQVSKHTILIQVFHQFTGRVYTSY
jgi:hypothetical protein